MPECAFCATPKVDSELGALEIGYRYGGKDDKKRGYYICLKCKTWHENLIQEKLEHTFMKIKARKEKPCCGGGS